MGGARGSLPRALSGGDVAGDALDLKRADHRWHVVQAGLTLRRKCGAAAIHAGDE